MIQRSGIPNSSIFGLVCLLAWSNLHAGRAGEFNPTHNIGDSVEGWNKLSGTDGHEHSMSDLKAREALVVVFTCNSCPYAVDYEDRIKALHQLIVDSQLNAAVVAINSNKIEADSLEAMKQRAADKKFTFQYLFDESQQVCKQFGAVRTPEFFVLDKERRIAYMGAMDDNTKSNQVTKQYVVDALSALLKGEQIEPAETAPVGCLIRFERRRPKK